MSEREESPSRDDRSEGGRLPLERLLRTHRPSVPPAQPEFQRALGRRFEAEAGRRGYPDGGNRWMLPMSWAASGRVAPAVLLAVVTLVVAGLWRSQAPRVPPAMSRAALIEHNARAWKETNVLVGSFVTGDGWYFEEWMRRDGDALMFKRFSRPPATTVKRPQWNISDGRTEWVVDADTRAVRATRSATRASDPDAPPQERLQCAALLLPPGQEDGPAPLPTLLDGRSTYRLDGLTADGQPAWFWVDAGDHLVRRIDRRDGITMWERRELDLDDRETPGAGFFRPESLEHL